ncbi:CopD family protein [Niabella yanshanensis]|uniref:CopD family protein n=1 Tax=Niabella yanshanensis TaxID=577386 RepID=A0ABZ0WAM3_9BACT|nr:CopD family protein [Niabella yanshanensis]WQD40236.1 CopD family protein [Niabella yanshanensis]
MSHHFLLIIHLLAATVWVGGHLYLSIGILPTVLRDRNASRLLRFEKSYEPIGMTALVLLVITGLWMTLQFGISWHQWLSFSSPVERITSAKILLLFLTVLLAVSAQTRVIPRLKQNPAKLPEMGLHIVAVTVIGIAMLVLGSFVRYGGI